MCCILPASAETIRVCRAAMYECLLGYPDEDCTDILWILYSGTLSREKLSQIGGFRGELSWIARFCHAKERHAPNFTEKTFTNRHKNATKVFSLESFPLWYLDRYTSKFHYAT